MEDPTALLSSPPRVLGKLRRGSGHLDLIAAHRDLADVETALAAQLLSEPEHFAPLHSRLRSALTHKSLAEYDVVLIDCAPNFGLIAKNAVAAADMLLIPTKPDYLSTNGIDSLGLKIRDFTDEFNEHGQGQIARPPAAVVFTMVQSHDGEPIEAQKQRDQPHRGPPGADVRDDDPRQQVRLRPRSRARRAGDPRRHRPGRHPRAAGPGVRALTPPGRHRSVNDLTEIALRRALATLSPEDLAAVAAGRARLEVRPVAPRAPRRAPATPGARPRPRRGRRGGGRAHQRAAAPRPTSRTT